jgi:uncharacterized protein
VRPTKLAIATILCSLVLACSTFQPDLPAITDEPTGTHQQGKVVWHDLLTNTPQQSQKFYSELFGWEFESIGTAKGAYYLIRSQGQLVGGMVDTNKLGVKDNISQWIAVLSVTDIENAVAEVAAQGGIVLTPPTNLASRGILAVIEDPQGAFFALLQTHSGDPVNSEPRPGSFLWDELWTRDVKASTSFYQAVLGYEREDDAFADSERSYSVFKSQGVNRAGILHHPFPDVRPVWANYLWVDDPSSVTARVERLDGKILVETQQREIGGQVALISGPSGAGIALQTWPLTIEQQGEEKDDE